MQLPLFAELARELLPGVKIFQMLDESLLHETLAAGRLQETTTRRLHRELECAREGGAAAVMVTCSTLGPAVAAAQSIFAFPVLRVDQAMAEAAVRTGRRVGVLATLPTTLGPTSELVRAVAQTQGRECEIVSGLCAGAYEAVAAGNGAEHDRLVAAGLRELMQQADVVVLAQASMARVVATFTPEQLTVPVLTSPRLGVQYAAQVMARLAAGGRA